MLQTQRSIPLFPATQTKQLSTLSSLLNLCTKPQHLRQIHARFILHGLHQNQTLASKLIDSYASLGFLNLSQQVFSSVINPNFVLYGTVLRNFSKLGEHKRTLLVYHEMVMKYVYPDEEFYPFVLRSCSSLADVETGKKIHGHVLKLGFDSFDFMGTALLELYAKCGYFEREKEVAERNPDTIISMLRSSVDMNSLKAGRSLHSVAVVSNLSTDLAVNTALLSMYSKLGSLKDARLLFEKMPEKDCVVWNIMISAFSQNGYPKKSLELLSLMAKLGTRADLFTAIPAISSVRQLKSIQWGKQMHAHVTRHGSNYQVSVHNSLIDMYCECNHLNYARKIFDLLMNKTVISWSSMIKGYVTHDQALDALSLFLTMKLDGVRIDFITIINILPACANIGALELVKYLHGHSMIFGLNSLASVNTSLLISYAKCGCIEMARKLFDEEKINNKDLITWNSMISAYAKHGHWSQCFELYNQMKSSLVPDQLTFLGLLTACVNTGLVKEGKGLFKEMTETYGCKPSQEHYACMVDLLGRSGLVREAGELVKGMPCEPDARVWGPLLSACKMHSETELAELAAEKLIGLEPKNAGNYVLLSNIYAAAGKWEGVAKMRCFLRDRGLKKTPGCSWLEINGYVHEFRVADHSHPKAVDIYSVLGNLELEIMESKEKTFEKVS